MKKLMSIVQLVDVPGLVTFCAFLFWLFCVLVHFSLRDFVALIEAVGRALKSL